MVSPSASQPLNDKEVVSEIVGEDFDGQIDEQHALEEESSSEPGSNSGEEDGVQMVQKDKYTDGMQKINSLEMLKSESEASESSESGSDTVAKKLENDADIEERQLDPQQDVDIEENRPSSEQSAGVQDRISSKPASPIDENHDQAQIDNGSGQFENLPTQPSPTSVLGSSAKSIAMVSPHESAYDTVNSKNSKDTVGSKNSKDTVKSNSSRESSVSHGAPKPDSKGFASDVPASRGEKIQDRSPDGSNSSSKGNSDGSNDKCLPIECPPTASMSSTALPSMAVSSAAMSSMGSSKSAVGIDDEKKTTPVNDLDPLSLPINKTSHVDSTKSEEKDTKSAEKVEKDIPPGNAPSEVTIASKVSATEIESGGKGPKASASSEPLDLSPSPPPIETGGTTVAAFNTTQEGFTTVGDGSFNSTGKTSPNPTPVDAADAGQNEGTEDEFDQDDVAQLHTRFKANVKHAKDCAVDWLDEFYEYGGSSGSSSCAFSTPANNGEGALPDRDCDVPTYFHLDDFDIGKLLGAGKFGNVYLARDRLSGYIVALKIMHKSQLDKHHVVENLSREITIQAHVRHENILRLYNYFWDQNKVYLVLEACSHGELYAMIARYGSKGMPESVAADYFRQMVLGVRACHRKRIVHRDIKPENVLITRNAAGKDILKLADFGWSVHLVPGSDRRTTLCGTLDYIAPEMVRKEKHAYGVDIWALGILLFEFLFGYPPFERRASGSEDETELTFQAVLHEEVVFPLPGWRDHGRDDYYNQQEKNQIEMERLHRHRAGFVSPRGDVSNEAKDLIKKFLMKNVKDRISLDDCLNHPWIVKHCGKTAEDD